MLCKVAMKYLYCSCNILGAIMMFIYQSQKQNWTTEEIRMGLLIVVVAMLGQYCTPLLNVSDTLNGSNNNGDYTNMVDII